jgi:hypothetical protein
MDWIKVLNKHILFEYSDLKDSEFVAWIKIMALAASLEKEPSREQMLKHVHYKTLDSLQYKLNTRSIDLQYIVNKVLIDVQYVVERRNALKINTQRFRERNKPVINDVIITSLSTSITKDKIREDNIKRYRGKTFVSPSIEEVSAYIKERKSNVNPETWLNHYTSNGWMVGKNKMKDWKASVRTWEAKDGRGNSQGGLGIPKEYTGEAESVSPEQRAENIKRARQLAEQFGRMPGKV